MPTHSTPFSAPAFFSSKKQAICFLWIFLCSFQSIFAQDQTFSNTTTTACSDDISGAASGGYVDFRNIVVSGLPTQLLCTATVLKQVNIKMGSAACKGNLTTYKARLKAPDGTVIQLFGNTAAGAPGFTTSGTSMWMDIKLRDDEALERVSDYTNAVQSGYFPYSIGYYRTTVPDAFTSLNGINPNGTWVLQIAENTTSEISFQKIDLIFGSKIKMLNITTCSGDNNFCSGSTCMGGSSIIRVNNDGYSQNDPQYMGNTVSSCSWNGANNNSAWLHFYAASTTAKITISGMKAAASSGSADQQAIVLQAPASCSTVPSVVPTGGCPEDITRNNSVYLTANGGGTSASSNIYSNGITANCDFNLSGLTIGEKYYLYIDGNGGAASFLYVEMVSGAQDCNLSGTADLATSSTNGIALLQKPCDDDEWTYYADPANQNRLLFGIQWNIGSTNCGGVAANNQTIKDNATVKLFVEPSHYGETDVTPTAPKATYTMKRWFEIEKNTPVNLTNPVNIRFFYDATEKAAIESAANAFASVHNVLYEGFQWFKMSNTYTYNTTPPAVVTPDTVSCSGLMCLTDANTAANTINGVLYAQFNGLTSFSSGTGMAGASGVPLPVKLTYFQGFPKEDYNLLEWETSMEQHNHHFIIEKSQNEVDFEEIGKVQGNNQSHVKSQYSFSDYLLQGGKSYYRLKQVDFNGNFSYSNVILIHHENILFSISPNPVKEILKVNLDLNAEIRNYVITNSIGQKIQTNVLPDNNELNISDLANGIYYIRIGNYACKFIKKE